MELEGVLGEETLPTEEAIDGSCQVGEFVDAKCATNGGTIKLSPGLTDTPATQTIKITGALKGCTAEPYVKVASFTEASYKATLKSEGR